MLGGHENQAKGKTLDVKLLSRRCKNTDLLSTFDKTFDFLICLSEFWIYGRITWPSMTMKTLF